MSNKRRQGKAYRPGPVHLNAIEQALKRARRIEPVDVASQRSTTMHNLLVLKHAEGRAPADLRDAAAFEKKCLDCWRGLADATNVAEALAEIGIGSGRNAVEIIEGANKALASTFERRQVSGAWAMEAVEVEAIEWLVALHCDTQLCACSYGEFERAYRRVVRVVQQALKGNVNPATTVISGQIGVIAEGATA